jgi:hypothetical protein
MAEETELPMEGVARLAVTFTAVIAPRKEEDVREDTTRNEGASPSPRSVPPVTRRNSTR